MKRASTEPEAEPDPRAGHRERERDLLRELDEVTGHRESWQDEGKPELKREEEGEPPAAPEPGGPSSNAGR
jgi:hypothetical protein